MEAHVDESHANQPTPQVHLPAFPLVLSVPTRSKKGRSVYGLMVLLLSTLIEPCAFPLGPNSLLTVNLFAAYEERRLQRL
jgi:hypothetical protein